MHAEDAGDEEYDEIDHHEDGEGAEGGDVVVLAVQEMDLMAVFKVIDPAILL